MTEEGPMMFCNDCQAFVETEWYSQNTIIFPNRTLKCSNCGSRDLSQRIMKE